MRMFAEKTGRRCVATVCGKFNGRYHRTEPFYGASVYTLSGFCKGRSASAAEK